jgi:hypothetical protein
MISEQGVHISSQNDSYADNQEGGDDESDKLEKVVEKKKFEEVFMKVYFGTLEEQTNLIF